MPTASPSPWSYRRAAMGEVVEYGILRGTSAALSMHFHDEDQVVFVLSGRRSLVLGGKVVDLRPGRCLLVPAGVVHRSLAGAAPAVCLNLYVQPARYAVDAMVEEVKRRWLERGDLDVDGLAGIVLGHRLAGSWPRRPPIEGVNVKAAAALRGMTREGFSRAFAREWGMAPHSHAVVGRLNQARRLLRMGEDVASVAALAGFADQSHLGRWFRRAFGVTPGRYRDE